MEMRGSESKPSKPLLDIPTNHCGCRKVSNEITAQKEYLHHTLGSFFAHQNIIFIVLFNLVY